MSANVTDKNKALVRRAVNEIWNKGDLDVVDELTDPNYVGHLPGTEEIRGPEGIKEAVRLFRSTFPDLKFSIESQVAEGDEVVTTLTLGGTHTGELKSRGGAPSIPPSGKQVTVRGTSRIRIAGGKVVEEWSEWDELGMLRQIDALSAERPAHKQGGG